MDGEEVELGGQMVAWCRIGGAMVATLRAELGRQNVANFCMLVFVEIGSNNCAESLEVLFFVVLSNLYTFLLRHAPTRQSLTTLRCGEQNSSCVVVRSCMTLVRPVAIV